MWTEGAEFARQNTGEEGLGRARIGAKYVCEYSLKILIWAELVIWKVELQ